MTLLTAALAVLHVVFAMNFLGAVFVLNLVLGPVTLALSPSTAKDFFSRFWPAMARFLHASIGGTALFGLILYGAGGFMTMSGTSSAYLDAGIGLAVLAIVEAEAVQIPAVNKLVKQFSGEAAVPGDQSFTTDQMKTFGRIKVGGIIGVATISLATILMVAAAWA